MKMGIINKDISLKDIVCMMNGILQNRGMINKKGNFFFQEIYFFMR